MKKHVIIYVLMLVFLSISGFLQAEDNWPHWRGPLHNGIIDAKNLPMKWSTTENILWKTPLPSWSAATPIIWEDRVFITSPSRSEPEPEPEQKPAEEHQGRGGKGKGKASSEGPGFSIVR